MSLSGITFTKVRDIDFIYSNAPENLGHNTTITTQYTVEKVLQANKYCEFELFHANYTGWQTLRLALVVKNPSSTNSATITIDVRAQGKTENSNYNAKQISAQIIEKYLDGYGYATLTLSPGEIKFIDNIDFASGYALGRYKIKSNISGVVARVGYADVSASADDYFAPNVTRAPSSHPQGDSGQFSGEVGYWMLTSTVDVNQINQFVLCEHVSGTNTWPSSGKPTGYINTNEYEASTNYIVGGKNFLAGNYGILYAIDFLNAANKTISISRPTNGDATSNVYILDENDGWKEVVFSNPNYSYTCNSYSSHSLYLFHPGGNNSNYIITIN